MAPVIEWMRRFWPKSRGNSRVRVIQPAGFTKAPLLRAGLIDEVDEVLLIGSSDVVTDDDLANFERLSTELGSPCRFIRHDISALDSGSLLLDKMEKISSLPFNGETWLSLRGSTNLLCGCLNIKFPNLTKLSIHPREDTFSLSNGHSGKVQIITEGIQYSLMNIELRNDDDGNHQIFSSSGILIAEPKGASFDDRGILKLSWWPENSKQNKLLSCQIGSLFNLNSAMSYDVSVTYRTMDSRLSRLPREVQLGVGHHEAIVKRKFKWFQNFKMPEFPTGKEKGSEKILLHVILNVGDIRSTIHAILAHEPDHVVLWALPKFGKTGLTKEQMGQLRLIVEYFSGEFRDLTGEYLQSGVGSASKNPNEGLPDFSLDCMFHLAQLNEIKSDYTGERTWPNCTETRFDMLPGFTEFQETIIRNITMMDNHPDIWYTNSVVGTLERLSPSSVVQEYLPPSPQHLFPVMGTTLRSESLVQGNDDQNIKIALDTIIENYEIISENYFPKEAEADVGILSIEVKSGEFTSNHGLNVNVEVIKEDVISITIPENDFKTKFGVSRGISAARDGTWVEDLSAQIIDTSWPSSRVFKAIQGDVNIGEGGTGKNYDIDFLAVTSYGTLVGECKISGFLKSGYDSKNNEWWYYYDLLEFDNCIGQLLGSVGLVGFRSDIIPLLVISKLVPEEWYRIAHCRGVVLCHWTELNDCELILDRMKNGTPPSDSSVENRIIEKEPVKRGGRPPKEKKTKKTQRTTKDKHKQIFVKNEIRLPLNAAGKSLPINPNDFKNYCIQYVKLSKEVDEWDEVFKELVKRKIMPSKAKASKWIKIIGSSLGITIKYSRGKMLGALPKSAIFESVDELHAKLKLYLYEINQIIPEEKQISEDEIQKLFGISSTEGA